MNKPLSILKFFCAWMPLAVLSGCGPYQVTLNEQPIYIPPPLLSQFQVADQALKNCLRQTIADNNITRVEQLTRLVCRHAGVGSLEGLETFVELEELDLSHNRLRDLKPLQNLKKLRLLKLNDNPDLQCETQPAVRAGLNLITTTHCAN